MKCSTSVVVGLKILRTWNVYDWCLDTDPAIPNPFTCIQVIKVEDKTAPSIVCPGPIEHDAAANGCSASLVNYHQPLYQMFVLVGK